LNTFEKKFPKTSGDDAGDRESSDFELDDGSVTRNSKVRGGIEVLHIKIDDTFDPYQRQPEGRQKQKAGGKRDLRKLSEHIKLMRKLEESKKDGGGED
jgi:hypothetical protein